MSANARCAIRSSTSDCIAARESAASVQSSTASSRRPTSRLKTFSSPTHAERGVFDGGDHESSLGPLALDGFGGDTGRGRDFREGGARVTFGGEKLGRGCDDPRPRLLRLLLTQCLIDTTVAYCVILTAVP